MKLINTLAVMRRAAFAALAFCVCAPIAAYSHDANTIAFYSFANLETGSSVTNGIVNEIDPSTFPGTFEVGGVGDVVVSDDAPGDYVFTTLGNLSSNDVICTKPKSIYFNGTGANACKLLFEGLASYLATNQRYTVEFFYKLADDMQASTSNPFMTWPVNCTFRKTTPASAQDVTMVKMFFANMTTTHAITLAAYTNNSSTAVSGGTAVIKYPGTSTSHVRDGKWHHVGFIWPTGPAASMMGFNAIFERRFEMGTYRIPYMFPADVEGGPAGMLDGSYPITLNASGNFKGWISCIRVSKIARWNNGALCASKSPTCLPQTVAYYRMEGSPDAAVSDQIVNSAPTFADINPQLYVYDNANDGQIGYQSSDTYGPIYSGPATRLTGCLTGGARLMAPVAGATTSYSADVKRERVIADGVEAFNTSSIRIEPAEATDGDGWQLAQGLYVSNTVYAALLGEYTFEMFFKFDKDLWMERIGSKALSPATSNLATLAWMSYGGTSHINSWNLSIDMTQPDKPAIGWNTDNGKSSYRLSAPNVADGKWHHIALVRKVGAYPGVYPYFDGVRITTSPLSYYYNNGNQDLNRQFYIGSPYRAAVGSKAGYQSHAFAGELDEIRITARALDPSEFLRQRAGGMRILFK